jgi:regulatory protein
MKPITYERALYQLAAYCSRAERCIHDLRLKMARWELSPVDQGKIIQALQKEKFLDESRYCRAFVNDKLKYNQWGIHKINYELKKKHIPDAIIKETLQDIDPQASREQLRQLLANKRKTVKGKNDFEIRQKLIRFAAGRGFSLEDIEAALS